MKHSSDRERMEAWAVQSPEEPGFHAVITPQTAECRHAQVFRLNLPAGEEYVLTSGKLEIQPVLIAGTAELRGHPDLNGKMKKFDAFYLAGQESVRILAEEDCVFYIAAACYEGFGKSFFRAFDPELPLGEIHQIHGTGVGQREVFMTLADTDEASRLICGLTWGGGGTWTSWPPHQHEKDLEEVYCYLDMPLPHFGLHLSYLTSGGIEEIVAHPIHSGTMVQAPCGYHPTVASPGTRNVYFWVLAALRHSSRSYHLAELDPQLAEFQS